MKIPRCAYARALALAPLLAVAIGCDDSNAQAPAAGAGGGKVEVPAAQPGVIAGTATTADGKPIKAFGGSISGYSAKSGQNVSADIDGADGKYATSVGPGQFSTRAWTDVEYNGRPYRIDLHPVDGKAAPRQDTTNGVVRNFVWKLHGWRPGYDARSEDRYYGFYGGLVSVYAEGNGQQYHQNVRGDYSAKPEPAVPAEATVEVTLTPDGPLIDGSDGKPVVLKMCPKDVLEGKADRSTRGVPIGKYVATARVLLPDGTAKPGRVVAIPNRSAKDAPPLAERVTLEFVSYGERFSTSVNRVDELNILVAN